MDKKKITIRTYNSSAENYQDKVMGMDLYNDTYDLFCDLTEKKNAEIFEIATGPGNVTKYILSKRPDFKITGIDLAPNMIELARLNNPKANFQIMDCRDIEHLGRKFDAIICGFCMPYLSKEECSKLILDASKLLISNGVLYFSTMEDEYDKSGFEPTSFSGQDEVFIYYHQADFLTECLYNSGLKIVNLLRKDCPEPDGSFLRDIIFISKKI